jgi:hypothetical protein
MLCCVLTIVMSMQARDAMLAGRARRAEQRHLGLPAESVLTQAQDAAVLDDVQVLPRASTSCPVMSHVLHCSLIQGLLIPHSFLLSCSVCAPPKKSRSACHKESCTGCREVKAVPVDAC